MASASMLTIVFRGLMVFHEDPSGKVMEVGILREPTEHVPRLLTITNGVLEHVLDLRPFFDTAVPNTRIWHLDVKKPLAEGVKLRFRSLTFKRTDVGSNPLFDDDVRWIMDLEGNRIELWEPKK